MDGFDDGRFLGRQGALRLGSKPESLKVRQSTPEVVEFHDRFDPVPLAFTKVRLIANGIIQMLERLGHPARGVPGFLKVCRGKAARWQGDQ